jgi:hypothetical protein
MRCKTVRYEGHCARCDRGRHSNAFAANQYGRNFSGVVTLIVECSDPSALHTKVCPGCYTILHRQRAPLAQLCAAADAVDNGIALPACTTVPMESSTSANSPVIEDKVTETTNAPQSFRRSSRKRTAIDRDKMPTVERPLKLIHPFIDLTGSTLESPHSPRTPKQTKRYKPAIPQGSPRTPASQRKPWKDREPPELDVQMRRFKHLLAESTEYGCILVLSSQRIQQ